VSIVYFVTLKSLILGISFQSYRKDMPSIKSISKSRPVVSIVCSYKSLCYGCVDVYIYVIDLILGISVVS
jgi:hypothetical protein